MGWWPKNQSGPSFGDWKAMGGKLGVIFQNWCMGCNIDDKGVYEYPLTPVQIGKQHVPKVKIWMKIFLWNEIKVRLCYTQLVLKYADWLMLFFQSKYISYFSFFFG